MKREAEVASRMLPELHNRRAKKQKVSLEEREASILHVIGAVGRLFLEHTPEVNAGAKKIKKKLTTPNSTFILNKFSPRIAIAGTNKEGKKTERRVITKLELSGTSITEVRFKGNLQGGIINGLPDYAGILDKFVYITTFKNQIGRNISYINDVDVIKANEQQLAKFLLKHIKALAKNNNKLNYTSIEQLCAINSHLAEFYHQHAHQKTIQHKFNSLLNFINRSIYNIFIHEISRRPDYDPENHPSVLSKQHILYSTKIGLKLITKGYLSLEDMFAQNAKYNLVTGNNLKADDPKLKEKFFKLHYLYADKILKNKDAVPSPNYIRNNILDTFSGPTDSPNRNYDRRISRITAPPDAGGNCIVDSTVRCKIEF